MELPKVVNSGPAFGHKNWYHFYCGSCGFNLSVGIYGRVESCKSCGTEVDWIGHTERLKREEAK